MTRATPMHDAVWVRQLVAELRMKGHRVERLLDEVGLTERELKSGIGRIPFAKHAALFEAAGVMAGDDCLGFHFGQTRDARDAGLIGYVGISSPTLGDAITSLSRYRRVFSDAMEIDIADLERLGRVRWWFNDLPSPEPLQCVEFGATNLVRVFRQATGRGIAPARVVFAHRRLGDIGEFERYFGCPVAFAGGENAIELKPADLRHRLIDADDRLLAILRRYCEELLADRPRDDPSLVDRVEGIIADRLAQGEVKLGTVAKELGMSPRSLTRRLSESSTSFTRLIEGVRREFALKYLRDRNVSLTETAFLLGYSDVSTFNHAFKRWTGETPTGFQRGETR